MKSIDFFLKNKEWYIKKGIPYNLGILLHGDPGCGKTRFIKQLMNYLTIFTHFLFYQSATLIVSQCPNRTWEPENF